MIRAFRITGFLALLITLLVAAVAVGEDAVDPTKASLGAGAYRAYCASCHGTTAEGNGDVAQYLRVKPTNLTLLADENGGSFPFETVVKIIDGRKPVAGHGQGEMPVWGDALLVAAGGHSEAEVQEKIEQLTHFIWTLQK
jgi:mono/diheme cytochrome c family protein